MIWLLYNTIPAYSIEANVVQRKALRATLVVHLHLISVAVTVQQAGGHVASSPRPWALCLPDVCTSEDLTMKR